MSKKENRLRILFIGNSHSYYNDMPAMVKERAQREGIDCDVAMLAHGGWFLSEHVESPDVKFNITYGDYDYVVLQEHAHPFGPVEDFYGAVRTLDQWIREAGSKTVLYMTWSEKDNEAGQIKMSEAYESIAKEVGALLAPVGDEWWAYLKVHPDIEMYDADGAHASPEGSSFAAELIFRTISEDFHKKLREK